MAENRDSHWKKLQQTKEHIERPKSAHGKLSLEPQRQQLVTNKGQIIVQRFLFSVVHKIRIIL